MTVQTNLTQGKQNLTVESQEDGWQTSRWHLHREVMEWLHHSAEGREKLSATTLARGVQSPALLAAAPLHLPWAAYILQKQVPHSHERDRHICEERQTPEPHDLHGACVFLILTSELPERKSFLRYKPKKRCQVKLREDKRKTVQLKRL